jgi:succinate-acetate transporter protein
MLLSAGGVLALTATAVGAAKPLPGLVFGLAALRFVVAGIGQLGGGTFWTHAAGIIGCAIVALAGYCVLAFELEGEHHRAVLPTFRRGVAHVAVERGADAQFADVINEPGVRQTT